MTIILIYDKLLIVKILNKEMPMIKERNTKQKMRILTTVQGTKSHPTAEQVHAMITDTTSGVSLATVYRNLHHLAELGRIRRISVINSPDRFDGDLSPHHHISCTTCGKFCDFFDIDYDNGLDNAAANKSGFGAVVHETVFYGECPECKSAKLN